MARARLVDVAQLAGVGVGTASDALAGKNRIPDETRERVRKAAETLGYVPNPVARALSAGRLPILGAVVTALRRPEEFEPYRAYWGDLIGAATLAATDRGYAMVVLPGLAESSAAMLPVSGMIVLTAHADDDDHELALRIGVPVIGDYRSDDPRTAGWIDVDYGPAMPLIMNHFVERGSRRPALLCAMASNKFVAQMRDQHEAWCAATGFERVELYSDGAQPHDSAAVHALLDTGVDAILTVAESVRMVLDIAAERGLRVGTDLLVAALSDDVDSRAVEDGITTVGLVAQNYADHVVGALVDLVEGRASAPVVVAAPVTVEARASTAGPVAVS